MKNCWISKISLNFPTIPICFLLTIFFLNVQLFSDGTANRHAVAGRVMTQDGQPTKHVKVTLVKQEGSTVGEQILDYDGTFNFDLLVPGKYLLTIERENFASIGRPIEIRSYPKPKTIILDIRLKGNEGASIRETVKDYGANASTRRKEKPSGKISRPAGVAFLNSSKEIAKGNREKAIEYLKYAIKAKPDFFEAYYNLGVQYQALKQWENAIQAYLKAIELREKTAKPNFNLGVILHEQGKLDQAIERYQKALDYDASFAEAYQSLGEAYFQKNQFYMAEQFLETATRLAPVRSKPAFGLLVKIQILNKDTEQAQYYLNQFLIHHPNEPIANQLQQEISMIPVKNP